MPKGNQKPQFKGQTIQCLKAKIDKKTNKGPQNTSQKTKTQ